MGDKRFSSIFRDLLSDPVFWGPPVFTCILFILVGILSKMVFSISIKAGLYQIIAQDSINFIMVSLTSLAILFGLQQIGNKKFREEKNHGHLNNLSKRLEALVSKDWYPKLYMPFVYLSMYSIVSYLFSRILSSVLVKGNEECIHLVGKIIKVFTVYFYILSIEYLFIVIGIWLLIVVGIAGKSDKNDDSSPYSRESDTDIEIVSGGSTGVSKEQAESIDKNILEMEKERIDIEEYKNSLRAYLEHIKDQLHENKEDPSHIEILSDPYYYLVQQYRKENPSEDLSSTERERVWKISEFIRKFLLEHGIPLDKEIATYNKLFYQFKDAQVPDSEKLLLRQLIMEKSQELFEEVSSILMEIKEMGHKKLEEEILRILEETRVGR
ncbi:MAG: hypothetical protein H0Z18_08115 [Thermococcus sp.]|uniref:hypothetical protein n=1 Tax=Thermococcus sp. TaxID=35749 RepID=UPI001D9CC1D3|nr:hypothetical protein [Thermococcus sp.]MBO8175208.1 hypothetical protein [Thermococcus sp.]